MIYYKWETITSESVVPSNYRRLPRYELRRSSVARLPRALQSTRSRYDLHVFRVS